MVRNEDQMTKDHAEYSEIPSEPRPFYFWMVLWGDLFRQHFLAYCLPSLLAEGNLPAVAKRRPVQFLIATTAEDWQAMCATPIFDELKRVVVPIFVELPPPPPGRPYNLRAIDAKQICSDLIFEKKGYAIFISPDFLYANGSMKRLHDLAQLGVEAVFNNAVTIVDEEAFFRVFAEAGFAARDSARDATPIAITSRQLVSIAMRSMHSKWAVIDWAARYFWGTSTGCWWRVEGDQGIVLFTQWTVLELCDYASIREHDSSILHLDGRGGDGDYPMYHFGDSTRLYVTRDSDEMFCVSWDPASYGACSLRRQLPFGAFGKGSEFRASFNGKTGHQWNWLQQTKLFVPTRLHTAPIDEEKWHAVELRGLRTLLNWVSPPKSLAKIGGDLPPELTGYADLDAQIDAIRRQWWRGGGSVLSTIEHWILPYRFQVFLWSCGSISVLLLHRLRLALRGDQAALHWWPWALRKLLSRYAGRPFTEPRPKVPDLN